MDNIQALQLVYNAARMAPLAAPDHETVKKCAEQLAEALKPSQPDDKVVPINKTP